ncbi:CsbD family protein [Undibacterium sp. Xuan67W]|uniref:CsbD family protein n=1 Tax=Undibacterium sp. Xuan67W TaxID=3413057 RepID=UPI003BF43A5A
MNKDQIKGVAKDMSGKVQESAGKLVGNREQQAKGLLKQAHGKAEKKIGDAKQIIKNAISKH